MWCGWIVTEVGRQPWIVHGYMRTEDAVTSAQGLWWVFGGTIALYAGLGVLTVIVLRGMSRRWREERVEDVAAPYSPPPAREEAEMSQPDAVAAILWIGITFYAVFGGADFGGGMWDLLAGRDH